jgi:transmembrane sensor
MSPSPTSEAVEQAIAWNVRLTSGDETEADWREFTLWLETNPQNRLAYAQVEELLPDVSAALADRGIREQPWSRQVPVHRVLRSPYAWLGVGAALAAGLILFVLGPAPGPQVSETVYSTKVGQTLSVHLADGSQADLNTNTRISAKIGGGRRRVVVMGGEVLFHVAKDRAHPFDVLLGSQKVRVLGTVFDVVRTADQIRVTVAEGRVRFSEADGNLPTSLIAGDQLVYTSGSGTRLRHVPPAAATAWRTGYLVYTDATLAEVVADLNRYFTRKIVIADASAAHQRFSGVLHIDSEETMLNRLSRLLAIKADSGGDGTLLLHAVRRKD